MGHLGRIGLAVALLIFLGIAGGPALAADIAVSSDAPAPSRSPSDLHLSVSELPGETSVRVPLASDGYRLYGLLSPYLSLGSVSEIGVPWSASLLPGLQRTTDGLDDVRLGAGMTLPLSSRAELYGEYRFLRGRVDAGTGRGLLQREPDSSDFRAGFSIRLN
jgi:hypothetical protein